MTKVKNQHYVPQFYLRRFTGKNELVYVFDKFTKKTFATSVRNIASETRFYDFHPDIYKEFQEHIVEQDDVELKAKTLDLQMVEHELAKRENKFALLFNAVLENIQQKNSITSEQKRHLAEFLVMQFLRTPEYRRELIEFQMSVYTETTRMAMRMKNIKDDVHLKFDEKYASLEHAQMMFNPGVQLELCKALMNHIWFIGVNTTANHFYTSDTPVVKQSHRNQPNRGVGLGSFGVEVAFPLTPKYMLILRERTAFHDLEQYDLRTLHLSPDNVTYYNSLQVCHSYRYVYCPFGEFLMAAEICCEQPEICIPDRKRWKVG